MVILLLIQLLFAGEFITLQINNISHTKTVEHLLFTEPVAAVTYDQTYMLEGTSSFELINPVDAPPRTLQMVSLNFTKEYQAVTSPILHSLPKLDELLNTSDKDWDFSGLAHRKPFFWTLESHDTAVDLDQQVLCFSLESNFFSNHSLKTPQLDISILNTFYRKNIEYGKQYLWILEWYTYKDTPDVRHYNVSAYSPDSYQRVKTFNVPDRWRTATPTLLSYDGNGQLWVDVTRFNVYCLAFSLDGQQLGKIVDDNFWRVPYNYRRMRGRIVEHDIMLLRLQQHIFRGLELSNIAGFQIHYLERKPVSLPIFVAELASIAAVIGIMGYYAYRKYKRDFSTV